MLKPKDDPPARSHPVTPARIQCVVCASALARTRLGFFCQGFGPGHHLVWWVRVSQKNRYQIRTISVRRQASTYPSAMPTKPDG